MIEIKNLVKTYHPKKGGVVKALNDVSIKFPETGLVFILGKSGSGKSTLLNIMGGLDTCDSGEIIIKGKSSKDFSQKDFDSYRNTYLGFIFQEYNILYDFNIAVNIALALKLQGKNATDDEINKILQEVDLEGYAKRKPNELSGGQKQRVAIARALVKNPEIIMADEPTGALDSKTGIQIFDTLKKLSKDKLVIVVSHDRDFAERYGDRVIEFKDGVVISDIEKHLTNAESTESGVSIYKNKLLRFPKGYKLTEEDISRINDYLANEDALLSVDNKVNKQLCIDARIDSSGRMESFDKTDESKIERKNTNAFKLIKSRMPLKEAGKMGVSSLKNKPFRLFMTVFMCFCCFTLFGLMDSFAAYNSEKTIANSMKDESLNYVSFAVGEVNNTFGYKWTEYRSFSNDEITSLENEMGKSAIKVYCPAGEDGAYHITFSNSLLGEAGYDNRLYTGQVSGFVEVGSSGLEGINTSMLYGTMPMSFSEVAISDYMYQHFVEYGYQSQDNGDATVTKNEIKDIATFFSTDRYIKFSIYGNDGHIIEKVYKISGVIDIGVDYQRYDKEDTGDTTLATIFNMYGMDADINYSLASAIITKDGFIENEFGADAEKTECSHVIFGVSDKSEITKAVDIMTKSQDKTVIFDIKNRVTEIEGLIGDLFDSLAEVFLYVGIGTLLFAVLLFMNYISISINYKKRDIGILRAVGAKASDVFYIFFFEALVIAGLTWVLSAIGGGIIVKVINNAIRTNYDFPITVLTFGIRQLAIMIGVCFATAFLSSSVPVFRIARKKPIDAIQNK